MRLRQILGRTGCATGLAVLLALSGCGQKGALFLPRGPAAAGRATLPEAVRSTLPGSDDSNPPAPAVPAYPETVTAPTPAASVPAAPPVRSEEVPR